MIKLPYLRFKCFRLVNYHDLFGSRVCFHRPHDASVRRADARTKKEHPLTLSFGRRPKFLVKSDR